MQGMEEKRVAIENFANENEAAYFWKYHLTGFLEKRWQGFI